MSFLYTIICVSAAVSIIGFIAASIFAIKEEHHKNKRAEHRYDH